MPVPDGVAEILVGCLAGALGFLAKTTIDIRARLAVAESRLDRHRDDVERICARLEGMTTILTDIRVLIAQNTNSTGAKP